jgi:hypothetical protein
MRIQAFIFNWPTENSNVFELERRIGEVVDVVVINSDERLRDRYNHWIHLHESAYFSAQWNKAMEIFNGDLLFHIQADANFDDFDGLLRRAADVLKRKEIGVYEPNVDFTLITYNPASLPQIEPGLFEVPLTDCTCWFVAADVLRELPRVDLSVNRYGWGICGGVAAVCRLQEKVCVRDYTMTVRHPRSRGYCSKAALQERGAYLDTLSPAIRMEAVKTYQEYRRQRVPE